MKANDFELMGNVYSILPVSKSNGCAGCDMMTNEKTCIAISHEEKFANIPSCTAGKRVDKRDVIFVKKNSNEHT